MSEAILGIGTNIGARKKNLVQARNMITSKAGKIIKTSSVYETEPWGFKAPTPFLNQVVGIKTGHSAGGLLEIILDIEKIMGRVRNIDTYEARVMDIDILFFDDKIIHTKSLVVPHPEIENRMFVLKPLHEIYPGLLHPVSGKTVSNMMSECKDQSWIHRLKE